VLGLAGRSNVPNRRSHIVVLTPKLNKGHCRAMSGRRRLLIVLYFPFRQTTLLSTHFLQFCKIQ
jgi:hypothetical protein